MFFQKLNFKISLKTFLHGHKESFQWKKTLYSTSMQHDMPQCLLVFAASFMPETPNFGTFGGVVHPP